MIMVLAVGVNVSGEDFSTGNWLKEECKTESLICLAYTAGVVHALNIKFILEASIPDGVTNGQYMSIVINYMNNHPEKLHENAVFVIQAAIEKAFPSLYKLNEEK